MHDFHSQKGNTVLICSVQSLQDPALGLRSDTKIVRNVVLVETDRTHNFQHAILVLPTNVENATVARFPEKVDKGNF